MKMEIVKARTTWSIVPDCGGLIEAIAISLPQKVFDPGNPHAEKILAAIGNLLKAMPSSVSILVFADSFNEAAARSWIETQTECRYDMVLAGARPLESADIWAQDSILVQMRGNDLRIAAPACDWPRGILPGLLAEHLSVACHDQPLFLPGGDQIVGEGFRLIGHTSRLRSASNKYGGDSTLLAADRRIGELDNRPVCYWGYRRQDLFEKPTVDAQEIRAAKNTADSNLEGDLDWQTANDLLGDLPFSHLRPGSGYEH